MNRKRRISPIAVGLVLALAAPLAPEAGATTFCVPDFSAACPNSGGRVKEADLEKAMGTNASDNVPDEIVIAAGTASEDGSYEPPSGAQDPGSIEPAGTDPLTIVGAGASSTVVTSGGSGNVYVLALGAAATRTITLRQLTVRVPASFPDGLGAAIQLSGGDRLEQVDVVSQNSESDGISVGGPGNLVLGGQIRGESGGSVGDGISAGVAGASGVILGVVLKQPSWGLVASGQGAALLASGVIETGARTYAAIATAGTITISNSILRTDDGTALYSSGSSLDSLISADHVTAVNSGGATQPAMVATKVFEGAGDAGIEVTNSILRGYGSGYSVFGVAGPGIGEPSLSASYSNFQLDGTSNFGSPDIATGNIDTDPGLNSDGSLAAGSPSIDTAEPGEGGLRSDIVGTSRPLDGDADCVARSDQGAFEYELPVPPLCAPPGGGSPGGGSPGGGTGMAGQPGSQIGGEIGTRAPDVQAPQTSIAKGPGPKLAAGRATFRLATDEAGGRFECKLDGGKRLPCPAIKAYRKLAPGKHTFRAWAIDAAGNRDATPARRAFRIPR